jgi:DNA-binding transcriptional LysR family regulator
MKSMLNMGQIEAFRGVMRVGTVIGAARLMNITQPGVSRSIGLLELRIGYKLFARHGRRLVPTPEAEALYREIEPLYASLDRIAEIAQDIRFQRAGALRIGSLPALSQGLVPRGIARFLSSRPKVTIFVESLPSRQIAERVSTRQLDVGIVELPLFRSGITLEPMEPLPFVAVMPAAHRLAEKPSISLKDLAGERMVLIARQSSIRHQIDDALASLGVEPEVVLETPSSTIACALVAAGAGITLVGKWTATSFASPQVVIRPIDEPFSSGYAIIFPDSGPRLQLADAFVSDLKDEIQCLEQ